MTLKIFKGFCLIMSKVTDQLVKNYFQYKIDKIIPNCSPYVCPTSGCGFVGKNKQCLSRHYTREEHGVLEKYLQEALGDKLSTEPQPMQKLDLNHPSVISFKCNKNISHGQYLVLN